MTSPKDALEMFQDFIAKTYGGDIVTPEDRDKVEDAVEAAIPVAKLHEQAVELLPRLIDTARTHAMQTHSKVSSKLADEANALLTKMEELQ